MSFVVIHLFGTTSVDGGGWNRFREPGALGAARHAPPTFQRPPASVTFGYGRQANCPGWGCLQVNGPQQLLPMTRHASLHWLWQEAGMQTLKHGACPLGHES